MKRVLMLISDGFEEVEALCTVDLLRRAEIHVDVCSITGKRMLNGAHGINVESDCIIEEIGSAAECAEKYDGVILPGGMPNSTNLRDDLRVIDFLQFFAGAGKITAAICAAPMALERAGLLKDIEATSYPECIDEASCIYRNDVKSVVSGKVITSRGVGTAIDFALTLITELGYKDRADTISKAILYTC
ncbi:MAG: DJ-1/PfpI family protein [Clostridia bacterium]|nr:DJ-1/PfpI family protein [Clostridia bacterium]